MGIFREGKDKIVVVGDMPSASFCRFPLVHSNYGIKEKQR